MSHPHKRAGLDIVEPPVLHQKFDGGAGLGALLYLVQQYQRPPRFHRLAGVGAEVGDDGVRVQTAGENGPSILFRDEVELHKVLVVSSTELPDQRGFADLAGAGDTQGLLFLLIFPFQEIFVCLAPQHNHAPLSIAVMCLLRDCNIIQRFRQIACNKILRL